ncbi:tachykinin-3a [Spinachia spinachia]
MATEGYLLRVNQPCTSNRPVSSYAAVSSSKGPSQRDVSPDRLPTLHFLIGFTQISYYYLLAQSADSSFILTGSHCRTYPFRFTPQQAHADSHLLDRQQSQSRCEEPGSRTAASDTTGLDSFKRNSRKRFNDLDYDSFVGLMGRRDADANAVEGPQKREMHDIFVGLMGRRNSEPENGPWRRAYPERRGIFLNKCRLRFLQRL